MSRSGMLAAKAGAWKSGHCNRSNPPKIHEQCRGMYAGCTCTCECHSRIVGRPVTEHATEVIGSAAYRSPEWYEARRGRITASEIAAVLGLSPWVSPFDLWWNKRTGVDSQADNKNMRRGHRYEALILEDFEDEHPELHLAPCGFVVSNDRPWQGCTPDSLAYDDCGCEPDPDPDVIDACMCATADPVAVVQAKSGADRSEWGEPGTDEIPMHYRCQVLWEMDTLGLNVAYVPVIFGFDYREYVVEYHEGDVALMREAAQDFLTSVREDRQPDVDAHTATGRRLKKLHPSVVDGEVEVPTSVVAQYHAAKRLRDAAEARMRLAENRIRNVLGDYRIATVNGRKVASRSVYDVKERTQIVSAHTVNRLTISKPKEARKS